MEKFSQRLSEALQIRHMSAAELSRKIDVNEGTISNYKKGLYEPKQKRLDQISRILNVSVDWLMGYDVPFSAREPEIAIDERELAVLYEKLKQEPALSPFRQINAGGGGYRVYTTKEERLLQAYKAHPEMQVAVDQLLGLSDKEPEKDK